MPWRGSLGFRKKEKDKRKRKNRGKDGDDKEGSIGVVGASDGPWRRWPAAAMVEDVPFCFFDDSAI